MHTRDECFNCFLTAISFFSSLAIYPPLLCCDRAFSSARATGDPQCLRALPLSGFVKSVCRLVISIRVTVQTSEMTEAVVVGLAFGRPTDEVQLKTARMP